MEDPAITTAFISQYQAALAMFRSAIRAMPAVRWNDAADANPSWRIAYHALYFTHLYLSESEEAFLPWEQAMVEAESIGDPFEPPAGREIHTPEEIHSYADTIEAMLPMFVPIRDYDGPAGFSWIRISRFEHHIRNIRHLQHHTGQLFDRARASGGEGLEWTGHGADARMVTRETA